jgi:hypothetical protein
VNEPTTARPPTPAGGGTPPADDRKSHVSEALDALAGLADDADADETLWREARRDLDAQRPHRPLFEGTY